MSATKDWIYGETQEKFRYSNRKFEFSKIIQNLNILFYYKQKI